MSRYEHGRVLAVNETTLGSELVGDHAAGVGSLTVEDPVDFDEDGGWLSINGQVVEYTTYDDDTGEITLVGTLDAAAGEGDRVDLWDELRQVVTVDKIAQVELDGDDDNTDPLEATIPLHLLDDLAEGIRGVRGESVLLEQDGDEWRIVDVLGLAANGASGTQFWQDLHTVVATGAQTITLSHEPIDNSEHLYWNGLYQPASEWSRNGQTVTVPDAGGDLAVGDELVVEYAYRLGVATPDAWAPPWWQGDPAQGCTSGYPLSYSMWLEWRNLTNSGNIETRDLYVVATVSMEFLNPAAGWNVMALYDFNPPANLYDTNPAQNADSIEVYGTSHNPTVQGPKSNWISGVDTGNNGAIIATKVCSVIKDQYADSSLFQPFCDAVENGTNLLGLQLTLNGQVMGSEIPTVNAAELGTEILGITRGGGCRFYLGQQVADAPHPLDFSDATAEPYL